MGTLRMITLRTVALRAIPLRAIAIVAARPLMFGLCGRTIAARAVAERAMAAGTAAGTTMAAAAGTAGTTKARIARILIVLFALGAGTHRRRRRHVLVGRCRDDGNALVGQALDALELAALAAVAERQRDARGAGARGAADAMDIALGVGRQLVVDDMGHAHHVDAARGEVGGDQHAGLAAAEIVERLLPRVLRLVAVDRLGSDATILQRLGDAIGAALGAGEDNDPLERRVGQQVAEQRALGGGVHEVDALVDLLDGAALRRDLDLLGVLQDLRRELGDVARHGGGEQQRLALLGDPADDATDVPDEAHVEHAVGLVDDEERHMRQLHVAALDQVEQAARRGDQDVDAARQGLDLAAIAQATDDSAEAQAQATPVGVEAARDLDRELTGRRQHEGARVLGLRALAEAGEVLQHGQREGCGLAGAGLGDAQHVATLQQRRNGARLDGRGHGVLGGFEGTQQRLGQAEIRKRNITHWN